MASSAPKARDDCELAGQAATCHRDPHLAVSSILRQILSSSICESPLQHSFQDLLDPVPLQPPDPFLEILLGSQPDLTDRDIASGREVPFSVIQRHIPQAVGIFHVCGQCADDDRVDPAGVERRCLKDDMRVCDSAIGFPAYRAAQPKNIAYFYHLLHLLLFVRRAACFHHGPDRIGGGSKLMGRDMGDDLRFAG
jgi:hypothetical protein